MKKISIGKKGFSLIELLATILIISIIFSTGITFVTKTINKSKERSQILALNNIKKTASTYVEEYANDIAWIKENNNSNSYSCVSVNSLINKGYLSDKDISSQAGISTSKYIIISRDQNKNITNQEVDTNNKCSKNIQKVEIPTAKKYCNNLYYNGSEQLLVTTSSIEFTIDQNQIKLLSQMIEHFAEIRRIDQGHRRRDVASRGDDARAVHVGLIDAVVQLAMPGQIMRKAIHLAFRLQTQSGNDRRTAQIGVDHQHALAAFGHVVQNVQAHVRLARAGHKAGESDPFAVASGKGKIGADGIDGLGSGVIKRVESLNFGLSHRRFSPFFPCCPCCGASARPSPAWASRQAWAAEHTFQCHPRCADDHPSGTEPR